LSGLPITSPAQTNGVDFSMVEEVGVAELRFLTAAGSSLLMAVRDG
jgi:hypothetical protein